MDKDRVKGKVKDISGRVKRQAGEWTGDEKMQSEGTADQAEGKLQDTWGKVKDKGKDISEDIRDRDKDKRAA